MGNNLLPCQGLTRSTRDSLISLPPNQDSDVERNPMAHLGLRKSWQLVYIGLFCLCLSACEAGGHFNLLGYTTRPNYDPCIRTVRVPIFKNETFRQGLEFELTKAVIREIESKTPFKVVNADESADTELVGKIVGRSKNVVNFNQLGEVRDAEGTLTVEVNWKDLRVAAGPDPLSAPFPLPGGPPMLPPSTSKKKVLVQSMASFRPELGQSLTSAEQTMVNNMAVQIISMMEQPW